MKFSQILFFILFSCSALQLQSQCESWIGLSNKGELEGDHSVYRQSLKAKDYTNAFGFWQKVYTAAPTADGLRDFHFTDGIKLYKNMLKKESDPAKKSEYKNKIIELYDQCATCYEAQKIKLANCGNDADCYNKKVGYLMGRKAYDMFYELNSVYSKNMEAFAKSVELSGNDTEYIVLVPYSTIAVYQFQKEIISKEETRVIHKELNDIADYNIENNERFSAYYQQAKDAMNSVFSQVERQIFDCDYFKEKLRPEYSADPDNPDVIKRVIAILKGQGCEPGDPFYDELNGKWKKYAAAENARIQAEYEAANPNLMAKKLYDEGNFQEAVDKYKEAIDQEVDDEKKASYLFSASSILFRKLNRYTEARQLAYDAAKLRPGWGRPYMLIGDMYGSSARSCGDSWNQRLAILAAMEKYQYAKSVDPEVEEEALERLQTYRRSMPDQEEGFMRGLKSGNTQTVGCWIGETVTVRYK